VVTVGDVEMNGETSASVVLVFGDGDSMPPPPLLMTHQDGSWCVQY
jgi:hypothetical protein